MRSHIIRWLPRVFGVLVCVFLGMFSLDAFASGRPIGETILDFAIHLAPVLIVFAVVALSWRWPLVGGVLFLVLAAAYALFARGHASWIAVIGAPLLMLGTLNLRTWRRGRRAA